MVRWHELEQVGGALERRSSGEMTVRSRVAAPGHVHAYRRRCPIAAPSGDTSACHRASSGQPVVLVHAPTGTQDLTPGGSTPHGMSEVMSVPAARLGGQVYGL